MTNRGRVGAPTRQDRGAPDLFAAPTDLAPGESRDTAIGISILNAAAKDIVEGALVPVWVRGEVTDFKPHRNGHWYFCLREGRSQIRAVMWGSDAARMPAVPDEGMEVVAFGRLSVYAARGEMQFVVSRMGARGDGLLRKALEISRQRLEADGLLRPERKRPLPAFPRTIAVVTSPDGAALRDIVAVVRRRGLPVRVVVVSAAVQGDAAPSELCFALDQVGRWRGADLVIVGRGGGGRDDLWAFNDERVARAVAACPVPTISAVGHEIDITLCDLVADVRAATPSAAAELATRTRGEVDETLRRLASALRRGADGVFARAADRLRAQGRALSRSTATGIDRRRGAMERLAGQIHALSPVATLARGYALPRSDDGRTLGSIAEFVPGRDFDLVVRDGTVRSRTLASTADPGGGEVSS